MIRKAFLFSFFLIVLSGCETMTNKECMRADWYGIGLSDGQSGRYSDYLDNHAKACGDIGIVPNQQKWLVGRQAGLQQYCTPENAFKIGRRGDSINKVCSPEQHSKMFQPFYVGKQIYDFEWRINSLEYELERLQSDIDQELISEKPDLNEIRRLRRKVRSNEREIRTLQQQKFVVELKVQDVL
ncbi:DUF2799 domain-containing protein [Pseudaestuariivita rosea]|uniref:DUF2799 domain-containing protein n=1 Tax=Pseudaestuariivita rosea TaxID=2763263 RepID=UPI001ABA3ED6|nr:DUF2799 domain-containing protein [Pseudaestuariivita rosea]